MLAKQCPVCGTTELTPLHTTQPGMEAYRCKDGHVFIISTTSEPDDPSVHSHRF